MNTFAETTKLAEVKEAVGMQSLMKGLAGRRVNLLRRAGAKPSRVKDVANMYRAEAELVGRSKFKNALTRKEMKRMIQYYKHSLPKGKKLRRPGQAYGRMNRIDLNLAGLRKTRKRIDKMLPGGLHRRRTDHDAIFGLDTIGHGR